MMCAALLGELIVLLGRKGTLSGLDEAPLSRVAPAVDYLHDHFQTEISLEECARLCQMSKYHFIRQFTALTGTPPHAYQTELRLQRARDLLADSTLNVSEVAASFTSAGYSGNTPDVLPETIGIIPVIRCQMKPPRINHKRIRDCSNGSASDFIFKNLLFSYY